MTTGCLSPQVKLVADKESAYIIKAVAPQGTGSETMSARVFSEGCNHSECQKPSCDLVKAGCRPQNFFQVDG